MHIHILGICGTFMGGIACLAAEKGYRVTGSDANVYPPMSTQLMALGITLMEGYDDPSHLMPKPDCVIIGNALKRGLPIVEAVLNQGIPYQSGPQWLAENLLKDRWVIVVSGTHGKTTTTSMIAWILAEAGLEPGFLIGGIPENFGVSARWGHDPFFVVEADEYDSAFFDKRAKFVHYHPKTCVINNIEFDHADIYPDLNSIQTQFHHLIRTVPGQGAIVVDQADPAIAEVLAKGVWSEIIGFGADNSAWQARLLSLDGSAFEVLYHGRAVGTINWSLMGQHNVSNALAAIAASAHAGVPPHVAIAALGTFKSVKRRMEVRGRVNGVTVYDDFAHHPTAIAKTLQGLRAHIGQQRLIAVLDVRSNTMCMGTHKADLPKSLIGADQVYVYQSPKVQWDVAKELSSIGAPVHIFQETSDLLQNLSASLKANDHVLIMSNGSFDGLHDKLLQKITPRELA